MPEINHFQPVITSVDTLIASGTSLSAAIDLRGTTMVGVIMPASWTTANLSFQASVDGQNYYDIYDMSGTEESVAADASRFIAINPSELAGVRYIKLRSGTTGTPVNQGADRTLSLVVRAI